MRPIRPLTIIGLTLPGPRGAKSCPPTIIFDISLKNKFIKNPDIEKKFYINSERFKPLTVNFYQIGRNIRILSPLVRQGLIITEEYLPVPGH